MKSLSHLAMASCLSMSITATAMAANNLGGLDVTITQSGAQLTVHDTGENYQRIELQKQPFEFSYAADQIGVCASTKPAVFDKATSATDTMSDFKSCLFVFKAFGLPAEGGTLIVDIGGANWLNTSHGAKQRGGKNTYAVSDFSGKETGNIPVTQINQPIYLAIWDDKNRNKTVDAGEVARVELKFN